MRKIYIIVSILVFLCLNGCKKSDKDIEADYITVTLNKMEIDPAYKWIVVLPGLGCHGCIQEGEAFMQEYIGNKDILFVLTKIESLKILQKKIEVNIKEHANIYIDRNRLFELPTDNSIYPCIIKLENGKIQTHIFQSPNNSAAFEALKAKM